MSDISWENTGDLIAIGRQGIRARTSAWRTWRERRRERHAERCAELAERHTTGRARPDAGLTSYQRTALSDPPSMSVWFR